MTFPLKSLGGILNSSLKSLGYPGNDEGLCYGMVAMARQAALIGEMDVLLKRLNQLKILEQRGQLANKISEIKHKPKSERSIDDYEILDIQVFLENLQFSFSPREYHEWFGSINALYLQGDPRSILPIIANKIFEDYGQANHEGQPIASGIVSSMAKLN